MATFGFLAAIFTRYVNVEQTGTSSLFYSLFALLILTVKSRRQGTYKVTGFYNVQCIRHGAHFGK